VLINFRSLLIKWEIV